MSPYSSRHAGKMSPHRAVSTVLRTTLVVLGVGVVVNLVSKPVYRSGCKMLLESANLTGSGPTSGEELPLITSLPAHNIATQVEVLKGQKVLSDAFRDADVPPGEVTLSVHQLENTDVVEIAFDSPMPTYAERMAKALPNTYLNYVNGNHKMELMNAFQFASGRLASEQTSLKELRLKLAASTKASVSSEEVEEIKDEVTAKHATVDLLARSVADLQIRSKCVHDPVMVISPGQVAVRVSPDWKLNLAKSGLIGVVLGIFVVGVQAFVMKSKD